MKLMTQANGLNHSIRFVCGKNHSLLVTAVLSVSQNNNCVYSMCFKYARKLQQLEEMTFRHK